MARILSIEVFFEHFLSFHDFSIFAEIICLYA